MKCHWCGKEFEKRHSFIAHSRVHSGYIRPKNLNSRRNIPPKTTCKFCGENFSEGRKLGGHMGHCTLNPKHDEIIKNMSIAALNKNRHWSDEDKKRISEERIKYLTEHPEKVPYKLNHSSKMSYPEKIFKSALETIGITGWSYNYQHGIYSYDFAFPNQKLDIEIDGNTHTHENVKKIDARRDKFSTDNGWTVIRFTATEVKENVILCIDKIKMHV